MLGIRLNRMQAPLFVYGASQFHICINTPTHSVGIVQTKYYFVGGRASVPNIINHMREADGKINI